LRLTSCTAAKSLIVAVPDKAKMASKLSDLHF